jgi:hypothetical protein
MKPLEVKELGNVSFVEFLQKSHSFVARAKEMVSR